MTPSRLAAFIALVLWPTAANAQPRIIDHTKARMYLNEDVIIEGPVARAARAGGGAVWFSLGKPHPSATLVVIVSADLARSLDELRTYEGTVVQVSGRVTTGEKQGIGMDRSGGPRVSGPKPRNPFIVVEDLSKFRVVTPAQPKPEKPPT